MTIVTEEDPPIVFTHQGKVTGMATEVVMEIQRRIGNTSPITVLPWARAYKLAMTQPNVVLYATMRIAERETQFKWVGPITTVSTGFYARSDSAIMLDSLDDARRAADILVPNTYYGHQFLKARGFTNLTITNTPQIMMRMLMGERSPLMVSGNLVLPTLLKQVGATSADVKLVHEFMTSQNYIAFSLATPDHTVQQWQEALNQMKRDGSFARIYTRWLPGEAVPGIKPSPYWVEGMK